MEDDSMLTYVVKNSLEGLIGGYEVITAVNGQEGLKAYQEHHPDIIISDVEMPVMNGFQMWSASVRWMAIRLSCWLLPWARPKM